MCIIGSISTLSAVRPGWPSRGPSRWHHEPVTQQSASPAAAFAVLWLATLAHLVSGPTPRFATRWAWFWR